MIAGRVERDPIQALIHGDVEYVLGVVDAEVDIARVARRLPGALLGLAGLDEGHLPAARVEHEDPGPARPAGGEVDPPLGVDGHPVAPFLVAEVDERAPWAVD